MHFRHISTKIQPKNLKPHFDWGDPGPLPGYALVQEYACVATILQTRLFSANELLLFVFQETTYVESSNRY